MPDQDLDLFFQKLINLNNFLTNSTKCYLQTFTELALDPLEQFSKTNTSEEREVII